MGYLQEFREEFQAKLATAGVAEERQEEILQWVSQKVLESYRHGQEQGQARTRLARAGKELENAGKRLFKQRSSRD